MENAPVPDAGGGGLDQFVGALSPTLQFFINAAVLLVAVGAAVFGYIRKSKPEAEGAGRDLSAHVVGGALADRASMQELAESNRKIANAIDRLIEEMERSREKADDRHHDDGLNERIRYLEEKLERPTPRTRR